MESSTLPDIPNSIYNGNGFNISSDAVHNQRNNGICATRKKIVIVGLGMVALSFMYVLNEHPCETKGFQFREVVYLFASDQY